MTSSTGQSAHERDGRDQQETVGLVWKQTSHWVCETKCKRYRIEKFAVGEDVLTDFGGFRYRVLRRTDYWDYQLAEPQTDSDLAKQICEAHVNGHERVGVPSGA